MRHVNPSMSAAEDENDTRSHHHFALTNCERIAVSGCIPDVVDLLTFAERLVVSESGFSGSVAAPTRTWLRSDSSMLTRWSEDCGLDRSDVGVHELRLSDAPS